MMHIALRLTAGLIATGLAPAAMATCYIQGEARQPMAATFADGTEVEVLERSRSAFNYKIKSSPTANPIEMTTFSGIFTLTADTGKSRFDFKWQTDLALLFPLQVGQKSSATANIDGDPPRQFVMSIDVVAAETIRIGDCDYPVLKIHQTSGDLGKPTVTITRYFNPDSRLTLRTERPRPATESGPAQLISNQIVELK